ncbi:hypothetical protein VCUG_01688 [Vavraia culicis subsp. floridensis]|uniref:Uncharacterized protein n=1 Tax=Vavraia culicis (isolate floridensis) TaxID=948595 RepID=L2GT91_VAVCU|nr:uncharacterized protein VCUG_01688 [Vavraia culicis subsp. floridensis]ELA46844.1 hypothetical protein VCUG_01688 [Vavraia culicis subsp. floridensis]
MEKQISSLVVKKNLTDYELAFKSNNMMAKLKFIYRILRKIEDNRENLCHIMGISDPAQAGKKNGKRDEPNEMEKTCLEVLRNVIKGRGGNDTPEKELGLAYAYMGIAYEIGAFGLVINYKKAYENYICALKRNHGMGAFRLAVMFEKGIHTKRSLTKAFTYYRCAAKMGLSEGMHAYGMILYYCEDEDMRDCRTGFHYIKLAMVNASPEYPHPYFDLGRIYETGNAALDLYKDCQYAYKIYVRGASFGCPNCCYRLGRSHEFGELNRSKSWREAIWWYKKAAELGQVDAQMALSTFYITGIDRVLDVNYEEAYQWTLKAAVGGHAGAAYSLGGYIEKGIGIKKDPAHALWWYSISGLFGNKNAKYKIEQLSNDVYMNSTRKKRWWFLPC